MWTSVKKLPIYGDSMIIPLKCAQEQVYISYGSGITVKTKFGKVPVSSNLSNTSDFSQWLKFCYRLYTNFGIFYVKYNRNDR